MDELIFAVEQKGTAVRVTVDASEHVSKKRLAQLARMIEVDVARKLRGVSSSGLPVRGRAPYAPVDKA